MAKMNSEWAVAEIDTFLTQTELVRQAASVTPTSSIRRWNWVLPVAKIEVAAQAHVVEQIMDRALPGWRVGQPPSDLKFQWMRERAATAKAALLRATELAQQLGDDAPDMDAAHLHPWAWENGRSFWRSGHFHQAVMQAAIKINAETQAKLGRMDVSEVELFNQAFSQDPATTIAPRLRLMKDDGSDTYKSLHRGARAFADGLFSAIRNPGMHTPPPADGGEEQLALEQLAGFSLLARWVDQAEVVRT